MPDGEIEPGPGETVIEPEEIDTAHVQLEEEDAPPAATANRADVRAAMDEKEAINQEIIKGLRENLEHPMLAILVVRIFNLGGALYDAGLDAKMPPAHRLIIGCVVLLVVIGLTNPDMVSKIAAKWKTALKAPTSPALPASRPIDVKAEAKPDGA